MSKGLAIFLHTFHISHFEIIVRFLSVIYHLNIYNTHKYYLKLFKNCHPTIKNQ